MHFTIIGVAPEIAVQTTETSIMGRARERGVYAVDAIRLHEYADAQGRIDSPPYGGGPGMLIEPEPVALAIEDAKRAHPQAKVVAMVAHGQPLTQSLAQELSQEESLILVCGRYEGIDDRVIEAHTDLQVRTGDVVLTGGELPAAILMDAVVRLLPGALGDDESTQHESFSPALWGKMEAPQYTRPAQWREESVPEVLLSGDHGAIEAWRRQNMRGLTDMERRLIAYWESFRPLKLRSGFTLQRMHWDEDICRRWNEAVNDPEITRGIRLNPPQLYENTKNFYQSCLTSLDTLFFFVRERSTGRIIGHVGMDLGEAAQQGNERSMLGLLIWEKGAWGRGYGRDIMREMGRIGLEDFQLPSVTMLAEESNIAAQRAYEAAGYVRIGHCTHDALIDGEWFSTYYYQMLPDNPASP